MESTNKFVDGLRVSKPSEKSPAFVKARLGIHTETFVKWLELHTKGNGYVDIDVLESRDGQKLYGAVNEWKPDGQTRTEKVEPTIEYPAGDINPDDLPF